MINVEQMRADNVQSHLIFLAEMASASQFEKIVMKIAMNLKNPQIFSQFTALYFDEIGAILWDYAYAADLITKAEADLMKFYENTANFNPHVVTPDGNVGEESGKPVSEPGE